MPIGTTTGVTGRRTQRRWASIRRPSRRTPAASWRVCDLPQFAAEANEDAVEQARGDAQRLGPLMGLFEPGEDGDLVAEKTSIGTEQGP